MRDHDHSPVSPPTQPALNFLSEFLPGQSKNSGDLPVANETSRRDPKRRRSALVVDDVADVTEMLSVLLSHAGYHVVTADSAREAIRAARAQRFDVVISDIGMPDMNGYQLALEMRRLPGYETVPMVAVTGYSMFDDKERSKSAGFNAHVTKPIEPRALLDLIEQL